MYKVIFWSTPVLFTCVLAAEEMSGLIAHVKLTGGTVEYLSEALGSYEEAQALCTALSQSKESTDSES